MDTWWDAITGDVGPDLREPEDRIGYLLRKRATRKPAEEKSDE